MAPPVTFALRTGGHDGQFSDGSRAAPPRRHFRTPVRIPRIPRETDGHRCARSGESSGPHRARRRRPPAMIPSHLASTRRRPHRARSEGTTLDVKLHRTLARIRFGPLLQPQLQPAARGRYPDRRARSGFLRHRRLARRRTRNRCRHRDQPLSGTGAATAVRRRTHSVGVRFPQRRMARRNNWRRTRLPGTNSGDCSARARAMPR